MAKIKLSQGFTNIKIDGKTEYSPFMPGDEVEVIKIIQRCPDRGCCELSYVVKTPDWNEGEPFTGHKYYDDEEVDIDQWRGVWDKDLMIMTYYPPD